MKGLTLSRDFFEQVGRPALEAAFPDLFPRMAVGLAGEGSECFGFDDALSRDHDWGADFCIWLTREDFRRYGAQVQQVYDSLPRTGDFPARSPGSEGAARVGCLSAPNWFHRYTGYPEGPDTLWQWRAIPEHFLATAVNGAIFHDPLGEFSAVRQKLAEGYPEDIRLKKLAARCAAMAQAGQYNCPRCLRRGERVAARLALDEFTRAAISAAHLLAHRYTPFYKWMHRSLRELPILPGLYRQLDGLAVAREEGEICALIEDICAHVLAELHRQGLSDGTDPFLLAHCPTLMEHIRDPHLRMTHIMEE